MSADQHINGTQLKMFMSAREITERFEPLSPDRGAYETFADVWKRKAAATRGTPLGESITEHGVEMPVHLVHNPMGALVGGGHHRVGYMLEEKPDALMPVLHHDTLKDAMHGKYYRYT